MDEIRTGLYSDKAYLLLKKFFKSGLFNYQGKRSNRWRCYKYIEVTRDTNNEVVLSHNIDTTYYSTYTVDLSRKSNEEAKHWLAVFLKVGTMNDIGFLVNNDCYHTTWKMKEFNSYSDNNPTWDRHCKDELESLNKYVGNKSYRSHQEMFPETKFNVADIYMMYDILLNRKNLEKRWKKKELSEMIGEERDPIATEFENQKRIALKDLENRKAKALEELKTAKNKEYNELYKNIEDKYNELKNNLDIDFKKEEEELIKSFSLEMA